MADLLGGTWSPIGWVVAFLEAPLDEVLSTLVDWKRSLGHELEVSAPAPYPACLSLLEPLEKPRTRELLIDCGAWTACLNNDKAGGDPTAPSHFLAKRLGVRCFIAINAPRHGPGHASTQLWVLGPDGEPPQMYVRTIAADAVDGRWSWHTSGEPLPIEQTDRYQARRVRDRFNRQLLVEYLSGYGIEVDEPKWFGSGVAVRQVVSWETNPATREQALAWLGGVAE